MNVFSVIYLCIIYFAHAINDGAQFLNATPLLLSSVSLAASSFPSPVTVIFHLQEIYASL